MKAFKKAFGKTKAPEASGHKPTPDGQNGAFASTAVHAVAGLSLEPSHARTSDDADSAECASPCPVSCAYARLKLVGARLVESVPRPSPSRGARGGRRPRWALWLKRLFGLHSKCKPPVRASTRREHRGADAKYGLADAFAATVERGQAYQCITALRERVARVLLGSAPPIVGYWKSAGRLPVHRQGAAGGVSSDTGTCVTQCRGAASRSPPVSLPKRLRGVLWLVLRTAANSRSCFAERCLPPRGVGSCYPGRTWLRVALMDEHKQLE